MKYLKDIVNTVRDICTGVPNVNTFLTGSVVELNNADTKYTAMVLDCSGAEYDIDNSTKTFNMTLFYADLQTADGSNIVDIQSEAVEILCGVMNEISERVERVEVGTITLFEERFAALTAGAFVEFSVTVSNDLNCKVLW